MSMIDANTYCPACGEAVPVTLSELVQSISNARELSSQEGLEIPATPFLCPPCDKEMQDYLDSTR